MGLVIGRLRRGDLLAAAAAVGLAVALFALDFYTRRSAPSLHGWDGLVSLRWLLAATIVATLAADLVIASSRAPALPVALGIITPLLGLASSLGLAYRLLVSTPAGYAVTAGAYVGLACAVGIAIGGWWGLADESPGSRPARDNPPPPPPRPAPAASLQSSATEGDRPAGS